MRTRFALPTVLFVLWLPLGGHSAQADEIHLADGRVVDGELRPAPGGGWDLTQHQGSMVVVHHLSAADVIRVVPGPTAAERERTAIATARRTLAADAPVEAWWALAVRARAANDPSLARELAEIVVDRERHHAEARRFLGFQVVNGVWMKPAEAALARGLMYHQGRWMSWSEREAAIAAETQRLADLRVEQERLAKERAVRRAIAEAAADAEAASIPQLGLSTPCTTRQPTVIWYTPWPGWQQPTPWSPSVRLNLRGNTSWLNWNLNWNL